MPSISAILIPGLHEVFVERIAPLPNLFVQQFCFDSAKLLSPPLKLINSRAFILVAKSQLLYKGLNLQQYEPSITQHRR
jgi:hypothetical protein